MNRKIRKIFIKLFCVLTLLLVISGNINYVFCAMSANFKPAEFESKTNASMESGLKMGFGAVLSVIRYVGTGIAIIALLVIAMRYMIASPGQRADYKKNLLGFLIGAFILIGASQIIGILAQLSTDLQGTP